MAKLTRRQRKRAKAAFRAFAGADLLIDYDEWKQAAGIRNDFLLRRIFDLIDADGTGFIDFDEFLAFAEQLYADDRRKRLEFIFRIYDLDGDGAIDRKEIRRILEASLSEQRLKVEETVIKDLVRSFMRTADTDRDGQVSLDEFVEVIGAYPGIDAQFAHYAADLVNQGWDLRKPRARAARITVRLRRAWRTRSRALFWGTLYVAANAYLFTSAMQHYAATGAGLALQVARGGGACLNLNVALVVLPMCRSWWTWIGRTRLARWFPLDRMADVHRVLGYFIVVFTLVHIAGHVANQPDNAALQHLLLQTSAGVTGIVATVVLLLLFQYGRSPKRRKHEAFVLSHLFYGVLLGVLLFHAPHLWAWLAAPLALFFVDALVRALRKTRRVNIVEIKPLADGVTRINFKKPKNFDFYPGDYLRLQVRELSGWQWHPFTISAAPESATVGVHVRNNGDWTGALHNLSCNKARPAKKWSARIDGPYGAPSSRVHRSKVAVLIAGGIGVTPFASTLQSIVLRHARARKEHGKPDQFLYFHWLNRSQRAYEWFTALLAQAEETLGRDRFKLRIHLTSLTHDLTNIAMQVAMDSYREKYDRDPITGLAAETSAGRPDWDHTFSEIAAAHGYEPVDVFFCGPPALGADVKKNCRKHGLLYYEEKF